MLDDMKYINKLFAWMGSDGMSNVILSAIICAVVCDVIGIIIGIV